MQSTNVTTQSERSSKAVRLHYLDWLQVVAVMAVFLFHAVHPFDDVFDWHIKNAESSAAVDFFIGFFAPLGMPFFFSMAGATSWFSLRRRTPGRYVRERVTQLLVPFIIGAIVLTPIQAYYELVHKGWWKGGSIVKFILSTEARTHFYSEFHTIRLGPKIFGGLGYHLWFVGFLFAYALIALPVFMWLKRGFGKRFVAALARWATRRGALLVFVIPLVLVRFLLQPGFPAEHDWADFCYLLLSFVSGYILLADARFMQAVRRDWKLYLILGIASTLFFFSTAAGLPVFDWMSSPGTPGFYAFWTVFGVNSWAWTMLFFYIGMRYLDFASKWLQYFREGSFVFFWVHQPVIIFIAFYVVQWQVSLLIKLVVVVAGSFVASLALVELVRRFRPLRGLFGMKQSK